MKDYNGKITYKGQDFTLVFNLNVMERIQEEYGSIAKWGELTDSAGGEPNVKAVIFGFTEMLNEGIDMENEETGSHKALLTKRQVGRMITEIGLLETTSALNKTVVTSTQSGTEKNA